MPALLHFESAAAQLLCRLPNIFYREHYARLRSWSIELQLHFVTGVSGNLHFVSIGAGAFEGELAGIVRTLRRQVMHRGCGLDHVGRNPVW